MKSSGLVLFICAGLLLSGGTILGGSTAWNLLRMSYYFWTTELGVELGSGVIFMAGALLCLPTCWLATVVPYHKSTSLAFALITLSMTSMLMLSLGVSSSAALSRALREPHVLNDSMLRAMTHVGYDPAVRSSFSAMQIELKCCGVQSSSDWLLYRSTLPPACCGRVWNGKRSDHCLTPLYTMGCLRPALCELKNFANSMTVLATAIIIVTVVTLFAAAYSLVMVLVERTEPRPKPQPICIACLPHSLPHLLPPSLPHSLPQPLPPALPQLLQTRVPFSPPSLAQA